MRVFPAGIACIASHTESWWRVPASLSGSSKTNAGSSRYAWSCTQARKATVFFLGASAGTSGERYRMPVTWVSVADTPMVQKGARTRAWKGATLQPSPASERIFAARSGAIAMPSCPNFPRFARRRSPGRRTPASASIAPTRVSTRSR